MKTHTDNFSETKQNLIKEIEEIAITVRHSSLCLAEDERNSDCVIALADFLGCTNQQAIIFATIFYLTIEERIVDLTAMASFLNCSPLTLMSHLEDLEILKRKQLIWVKRSRRGRSFFNDSEYYIPSKVCVALGSMDKSLLENEVKFNLVTLLEQIYRLIDEREDGNLTYFELVDEVIHHLNCNADLKFIQNLSRFDLERAELLFYLYACREAINGDNEIDLGRACNKIYEDASLRFEVKKELIKGNSGLIKHDLVSLQDGRFKSDRDVMLTDKSLELLMEEDIDIILSSSKKNKNLILSKNIPHKKLFFNPDENNQLEELTRILEPANFSKIQKRLKSNNMSDGIAVLFHGCPGTGKTESTYQIARKVGRDIILVDMSDTKSMWYGESEKKIKAIFTDYKKLIGNNKLVPILVFNEADAVFSKRKNIGESAIDQTENTIQNIILQELEDFRGILIATTNLTNNFDKAFERRFLYKIEFYKPNVKTRTKIWKDKIKGLTIAQARLLASQFDLTGGNIDNVARKALMKDILQNRKKALQSLYHHCEQESIGYATMKKIGFI